MCEFNDQGYKTVYQKKNNKANKFTDPLSFVSFYISSVYDYASLFSLYSVSIFFQEFLIIKYLGSWKVITF